MGDDKETIKFVIEKARRKVNEQLDKKQKYASIGA